MEDLAHYEHDSGLLSRSDTAGNRAYYLYDALGNTDQIVTQAGAVANAYAYGPFGALLRSRETFPNRFQFVGHAGVMAEASGLNFMRARFYSAARGRFDSEDPLGSHLNGYQYAINSPAHYVDPEGLTVMYTNVGISGGGFGFGGAASVGVAVDDNGNYTVFGSLGAGASVSPRPNVSVGPAFGVTGGTVDNVAGWGAGWGGSLTPKAFLPLGKVGPLTLGAGLNAPSLSFGDKLSAGAEVSVSLGLGPPEMHFFPTHTWATGPLPLPGVTRPPSNDPEKSGPKYRIIDPSQIIGPPVDSRTSAVTGSKDPNQKLGLAGYGSGGYVAPDVLLAYRIDFENATNATAPAQIVTITDPMSRDLDWSTFRLTEIGFGDQLIAIPGNTSHFETNSPVVIGGAKFELQIESGVHLPYGQVYATFSSIDPSTSLPPPVNVGFLPPEDGTGRGQGHVSFTMKPRPGLPTGTEIRNVAAIRFDRQAAIFTNQRDPHNPSLGTDPAKESLNTIDGGAPTSRVRALPPEFTQSQFLVQGTGQDDARGSGIAAYDIYVSDNKAPWTFWKENVSETSALFSGLPGHTYGFYSVARDHVGNQETAVGIAQTVIKVIGTAPPEAEIQFTPVSGPRGTLVTITGTNLAAVVAVQFNRIATGFRVNSLSEIIATVPEGATTGPVSVTTSVGSATSAKSFAVTASVNRLPVVAFGSPDERQTFSAPANILLTAAAIDPDGTITRMEFYSGGTRLYTQLAAPASALSTSFIWSNVVQGTYILTVLATDNQGASAFSKPLSLTVGPGVEAIPLIQFTRSGEVFTLTWPTNAVDFRLESTTSLSPPIEWRPVRTQWSLTGDQYLVIEPISTGHRFYRLKRIP